MTSKDSGFFKNFTVGRPRHTMVGRLSPYQGDLLATLCWLSILVQESYIWASPDEVLQAGWKDLPSTSLSDLSNLFKTLRLRACRSDQRMIKAIEILEKESLDQLGGAEIASGLRELPNARIGEVSEERRGVGQAVQEMWASHRGGEGWQGSPIELARLMVALAKPSVLDHVYDPFAGRGGFLIEAWKICEKEASSSIRLSGSEINPVAWARTQVLFSIYGIEADLRLENAFSFRTPMEKPTLILTDPPVFSGKEIGPGNPTPRNTATANLPNSLIGSFVGIDQILSDLYETRGRAFVVVPPRVLFGGGSVARARQIWVIKDCLEAVVTLPRGLFHPVTHLPMALAVFNLGKSNLRKGRVLLIDGEELGRLNLTSKFSSDIFENQSSRILEAFHTFQPIPRFSAIATFEDIKSHDWNLSPKGYLAQPPDPHHHPDLEGLTLQVAQLEAEAEKAQNRFRSSAEDLRTWLKDARTSR